MYVNSNIVNLEKIINCILDDESNKLIFMKRDEKLLMDELLDYTDKILKKETGNLNNEKIKNLVENDSANLIDTIVESNFNYFRAGMQAGICLLLELLIV